MDRYHLTTPNHRITSLTHNKRSRQRISQIMTKNLRINQLGRGVTTHRGRQTGRHREKANLTQLRSSRRYLQPMESDKIIHEKDNLLGNHTLAWKENMKLRLNSPSMGFSKEKMDEIRQKIMKDKLLTDRFLFYLYFCEYNDSKKAIENFKRIVTNGKGYLFKNTKIAQSSVVSTLAHFSSTRF